MQDICKIENTREQSMHAPTYSIKNLKIVYNNWHIPIHIGNYDSHIYQQGFLTSADIGNTKMGKMVTSTSKHTYLVTVVTYWHHIVFLLCHHMIIHMLYCLKTIHTPIDAFIKSWKRKFPLLTFKILMK